MSGDYMQGDPDKNSVIVPFSDDEPEAKKKLAELEDDDSPTASPVERTERRKRRQERLQLMLQESQKNAERVKELEEKLNKTSQEQAELRGMLAAQQAMRTANDNANAKDPYEARLDDIYRRQAEAYAAAQAELSRGNLPPERQAHYERIAREIETEKTRIHTERAVSQAIAQDRETRRGEQAQQVWVQKYPEVYNNPRAFEYAQAKFNLRTRGLGEQPTNALADEVFQETIAQFKLGAKPAPTASDRARMSGIPSAGSGGGGRAPTGIDFSRNPELRRMALAAYSDLPEAEALKKWTDSVGKKLREKKVI